MSAALARVKGGFATVRAKRPFLDHLVQAASRYSADAGNQLAAAITYFSFLSLFPLLLLAVSVLGFVLHGDPHLQARVIQNIQSALPGQTKDVISGAVNSRRAVGLVGLFGLLYSGLGWVENLRTAIRTVWHQNVKAGNIVKTKLSDLVILVGLGLTLATSVVISGVGNAATSFVIGLLNIGNVPGVTVLTKIVTIAIAIGADVLIFLWLFIRLPKVQTPWRRVLKGALFASIGFEILKLVGAFYIARTTKNATATYGALGVVIGALVWINTVSRFMLFAAVWTVTAPYDDDVAPSGTADRATARAAGIPEEFAADDADSPNSRQERNAPTPLTPALQGKPGVGFGNASQDDPTGRGSRADRSAPTRPGGHEPGRGDRVRADAGSGGIQVVDPYPTGGPAGERRRSSAGQLAGVVGAVLLAARSLRDRRRH